MKELLQMLAVLKSLKNDDNASPIRLLVYADGTGRCDIDIPSMLQSNRSTTLFSFSNVAGLNDFLMQEIGEEFFKQKVKELGLDKL